jgi:hypothetical protein
VTTGLIGKLAEVVRTPFRQQPTQIEQVADLYIKDVRSLSLWQGEPTVFPSSRKFFIHHMRLLDPFVLHTFIPAPALTRPPVLAETAPGQAGELVIVYGRVIGANVTAPPTMGIQRTIVQLIDAGTPWPLPKEFIGPIVDCEVPLPKGKLIQPGTKLFAEGVVIAAGNAIFSQGGYRPLVFLACDALILPQGHCGAGFVPPLPDAGSTCPGRKDEYVQMALKRGIHNTVQ